MERNDCHEPGTASPHVLVVDDEPANRRLVRALLEAEGYRVSEAENGEEALAAVTRDAPEAVLLDLTMPGMDGLSACRRLKADPATAPIPVIVVTSRTDREDRLAAIDAGANDFLPKPMDTQEAALRVRNAVRTKRLYDEARATCGRLRDLEATRDELTHMVVHDLRSPLVGLTAFLELLEMQLGDGVSAHTAMLLSQARTSASMLNEIIGTVLDMNRVEQGRMPVQPQKCDVRDLASEAVRALGVLAQGRRIRITTARGTRRAWCDPQLVQRVLVNLIGNALRAAPSGDDVRVRVERRADGGLRVSVADTGAGIPVEARSRVFEKYGQVEARPQRNSSGLGLAFCRLAVEAHNGVIGVESEEGKGSTFWFTLPAAPAAGRTTAPRPATVGRAAAAA